MRSRFSLTAGLLLAAAAPAQSGRTMALTAPPRLGTTMVITLSHPVGAAGNYYEVLFSMPTASVTDLGLAFVVGRFRLDLNAFGSFLSGSLGANGTTTISVPVPNLPNLIGGGVDMQTIDVAAPTLYLADNDLEIRPFPGICKVQLLQANNRSPVSGDNDVQVVDDATLGAPVSQGLPRFAFQSVQPRGQEGFVEGYGGPFTGISHNSDIEVFTERRVAKRSANPVYQVVALPNGHDVGLVRHMANTRLFSVWTLRRSTGVASLVSGTSVVDTGPLNTPVSNLLPHAAFSADGQWGVVIARDTNTAVRDRVLAFRTDGSVPAIDITALAPLSTTYFDGSALFTDDFLLIAGSGGWYWTSATAPARLAALPMPNTTASNRANRWVYPFSWRVSRDGATAWLPIGSHATSNRGEMDIVRVSDNAGVPQVTNVTQFATATAIAEFGYSAVTPGAAMDSTYGMKAALSPDGSRLAFLGMNGNLGVYVAGAGSPLAVTVSGASFYSELTFLNASKVLFCAGSDPAAQNLYVLDVTTGTPTPLTTTGDLVTRGQFWSTNRRYWYFVRSNGLGTVNNFVGVDAAAANVALIDITGGEFASGTAPALRTGGMNVTQDPWPGLEFQLRRVPLSDYAVFTARRTTTVANAFEDANLFRFDIEHGGAATMLTANTGTGADDAVRNMESLVVSGDPLFAAWAERAGIYATISEDVYTVSLLGGGEVRRISVPDATGKTVVDGSIRFTCVPAAGVVWAVGKGSLDVPEDAARIEWSALGTANPPVRLTPALATPRVYQVIGVSM